MAKYLLDTNICVFIMRGKHPEIKDRLLEVGISECAISEITVGELLYGAHCSGKPDENIELVKNFCSEFNVISLSVALEEFARQKARLRNRGELIDDMDMLIGVTAVSEGMTLITDNIRHFERLENIQIENWVTR